MKATRIWVQSLMLGLFLGIAVADFAIAQEVTSSDLAQRIQTAKTPADHSALADYYAKEAANAKAQADQHAKMEKLYLAERASGKGLSSISAHCKNIVKQYQQMAADYDAMAVAHREAAKAKP